MKDKDRELRRVVHELTTQIIGELVGYFKDEEGFVIKLEDDAISQIKALYKPLGKEEIIEIAKKNFVWKKTIIKITKAEKRKSPIKEKFTLKPDFDILAQAIINARGE